MQLTKFWNYVMISLADVDGFKICMQVYVWLGFRPLIVFVSHSKSSIAAIS